MTCGCKECEGGCTGKCGCQECNPCAEKKECCVPNIVADGDCIDVVTDDKGVIHLSTRCNPEIISSDNSVNVTVDKSGDVDVWDLKVTDDDHLVGACGNDKNPGTLDEKIVGVDAITVTPVCSNNGKIEIGIDESQLHYDNDKVSIASGCPSKYLSEALIVDSKYIRAVQNGCSMVLTDKETAPLYYAKLVLEENHIWEVPIASQGESEKWLGEKANVQWRPVYDAQSTTPVSMLSGLKFYNGTPENPGLGRIEITKKGIYHVGFTGSAEFNYGVHAFRVQLYKSPRLQEYKRYFTIVESRYSAPLGYQPWQDIAGSGGNISASYVTNIGLREDDTVSYINHGNLSKKIDFPLVSDKTEVEGLYQEQVYSQSLGAVMDRVTVTGNTIVELDVGDLIYVGLKVSTEVDHTNGNFLNNVPDRFKRGHFALLGNIDTGSDNGGEAGFSYYVDLIHTI